MTLRILTAPERHGDMYRTTLDGSDYEIEWRWNTRSSRWWLRISDTDGQIVYEPAVAGFPLLRSVTGTRRPAGELVIIDVMGQGREPGLRDFVSDFAIVYFEADDLPEGY